MKPSCVVIPVHSANPSHNELLAFRRCFEILGAHDIYVVAPHSLDLSAYSRCVPVYTVKTVDSAWLSSIVAYNKMKIDPAFYRLFDEYTFMLTYELDAYVFRDELTDWCSKGFDYIGAPLFSGYDKQDAHAKMIGVGNSGFSLRNIQTCLQILGRFGSLMDTARRLNTYKLGFLLKGFAILERSTRRLTFPRVRIIRAYLDNDYMHEDMFWTVFVPRLYPAIKIADTQTALAFSFDSNPQTCYKLSGYKLPFGCHAWMKYDPAFWNGFIK